MASSARGTACPALPKLAQPRMPWRDGAFSCRPARGPRSLRAAQVAGTQFAGTQLAGTQLTGTQLAGTQLAGWYLPKSISPLAPAAALQSSLHVYCSHCVGCVLSFLFFIDVCFVRFLLGPSPPSSRFPIRFIYPFSTGCLYAAVGPLLSQPTLPCLLYTPIPIKGLQPHFSVQIT